MRLEPFLKAVTPSTFNMVFYAVYDSLIEITHSELAMIDSEVEAHDSHHVDNIHVLYLAEVIKCCVALC